MFPASPFSFSEFKIAKCYKNMNIYIIDDVSKNAKVTENNYLRELEKKGISNTWNVILKISKLSTVRTPERGGDEYSKFLQKKEGG